LAKTQIVSAGSISIKSTSTNASVPGVVISNTSNLTANGGNILVVSNSPSTSNSLTLPDGGSFTAIGGNVSILAKGAIQGGTNTYRAEGLTAVGNGGIEIVGGSTISTLGSAFLKLANTQPAVLGVLGATASTVGAVSNTCGVIVVNNLNGGTVNLSGTGNTTVPQVVLNHGAMVFGANGTTVILDGGTFTTSSSKPIAEVVLPESFEEMIVDAGDDQ
jgi:hypothetical protein